MKKAQIQQVFIYLMAMLVIGFLVLFGYRMIDKLLNQKCDLEDQTLMNRLTTDIEGASRYGQRTQIKLNKPCDYNQLCIVEADLFKENTVLGSGQIDFKDYPLIRANVLDKITYNFYLLDEKKDTLPLYFNEQVHLSQGKKIHCIEATSGQFTFWAEGLGGTKGIEIVAE